MSEPNYWTALSAEESRRAMEEIMDRAKAIEGLTFEGEVSVIDKDRSQGFLLDEKRQNALHLLFRCFPDDIRKLLSLLAVAQVAHQHCQEQLATAEARLSSFDTLAVLLMCKAKDMKINNFIRQRIGNAESQEIFTVEVRRERLSPEEADAFFAASQKLEHP